MIIRFYFMMVRNDFGIVRLKEIGPGICVEYITLKQSHVIKNISRPDLGGVQGAQPGWASKCYGPQTKN